MYNTYDPNKLPPIKIKDYHKHTQTGLRIDKSLKKQVAKLAEMKGTSMNSIYIEAIKSYVAVELTKAINKHWDEQTEKLRGKTAD